LNITLPQAAMTLVIAKSPFVAFMQTILPPIIFCIVSAFSYLFRMDEDGVALPSKATILISTGP
jgi:hypothetical protein